MNTFPNRYSPIGGVAAGESLLAYPPARYTDSTAQKRVLEGILPLPVNFYLQVGSFFKEGIASELRTCGAKFPDVRKFICGRQEIYLQTSRNFTADVRNF